MYRVMLNTLSKTRSSIKTDSSKMLTAFIRRFVENDFVQYQSWYDDPMLNTHLGPIDYTWLSAVLEQKDGMEYSYFESDQLAAVVGIVFHPTEHAWVITDIAVNPALRRQGVGARALQAVIEITPMQPPGRWLAYVMQDNTVAQAFFSSLNWTRCEPDDDDPAPMITFRRPRRP